jgi:hypothetical protein
MAEFSKHPTSSRTKLLVVGDSGAGKTALVADLANKGYNVRILDFDDGLDILASLVKPEAVDHVHYETVVDDEKTAKAFVAATKLIFDGWKTQDEDLGHIREWTDKDVLVVDSLTFMSEAAKRVALTKNGRKPTENLSQPEWGMAQRLVINFLSYIMSSNIKCNVVVTSHLQYIEEDGKAVTKAYPASCGRGISTIVGRFFNNVVRLDSKIVSGKVVRKLRTVSDTKMDLKNTAPNLIAQDEEPDLAAFFEKVQDNAKKSLTSNSK